MKFKSTYTNIEIQELKEIGFRDFSIKSLNVIEGVYITNPRESFLKGPLNIYLGNDYYGEITIDNFYHGKDNHSPIIYAGRISHMGGLTVRDRVSIFDIYPELRGEEFTLTEEMLKHLVIVQLRNSYPMAIWPDPKNI